MAMSEVQQSGDLRWLVFAARYGVHIEIHLVKLNPLMKVYRAAMEDYAHWRFSITGGGGGEERRHLTSYVSVRLGHDFDSHGSVPTPWGVINLLFIRGQTDGWKPLREVIGEAAFEDLMRRKDGKLLKPIK